MHRALQVGIEDCRHAPFVFPQLAHNLPRQYNRHVADVKLLIFATDDFLDLLFMDRVEKTPEQGNHEGPRSFADQIPGFLSHIVLVQGTDDSTRGINTFLDADDHVARNNWIRLLLNA